MQKADRQSRIILTFIKSDIKRLIIKLHDKSPLSKHLPVYYFNSVLLQ